MLDNRPPRRHRPMTREEYEYIMRRRRAAAERARRERRNMIICISLIIIALIALIIFAICRGGNENGKPADTDKTTAADTEAPNKALGIPDWITVDLLPINEYSRPGTLRETTNGVVVHTTGNPGTTAEQNRSYYYNVSETGEAYVSSNFVVGIDGRIIMCMPPEEIAYCSNNRNSDTVSIECCHEEEDGKLSAAAYASLLRLTAWLCERYELDADTVIRHYDVTGKECPRYYTDNPSEWDAFINDVENELKKGTNQ